MPLTFQQNIIAKQLEIPQKFTLLTMLYNETHEERCQEFITCMEVNLKHPSIKNIHVFFDTINNSDPNKLLDYLKSKPVSITYINGRASFEDFWKLADKRYNDTAIIISNADIYFDNTLTMLEKYDLSHMFIALTRWDINEIKSESLAYATWDAAKKQFIPFTGRSFSQDTWIFKTPLPKFKDPSMKLGMLHFDPRLAYQARQAGLQVINPCLNIKCHHLHLSGIRHYQMTRPEGPTYFIPFSTLTLNKSLKYVTDFYVKEFNLPLLGLPFEILEPTTH